MTKTFASIVITGASSGIGEALALDYAAPGIALALSGRDAARLQAVAEACRAKGATVDAGQIDVVDKEALAAWLTRFDEAHPVDLLIANAGISIDKGNSSIDDFSIIRKTMAVNVDGVFNTVEPLIGRMMARGRGQIAVVSSLAGFIGLPYSASYNASKAARAGVGREPALRAEEERHRGQRDLPRFRGQPHDRQRSLPDALPDVIGARLRDHSQRPGAQPGEDRVSDRHEGRRVVRQPAAGRLDSEAARGVTYGSAPSSGAHDHDERHWSGALP